MGYQNNLAVNFRRQNNYFTNINNNPQNVTININQFNLEEAAPKKCRKGKGKGKAKRKGKGKGKGKAKRNRAAHCGGPQRGRGPQSPVMNMMNLMKMMMSLMSRMGMGGGGSFGGQCPCGGMQNRMGLFQHPGFLA